MITRMCEAETVTNHADVSRSDGENGIMRMSAMRGAMKREVPLSYALVIVRGVRAAQRKPATQRAR